MYGSTASPAEVFSLAREKGVEIVDLRFMDFPGLWQHFSVPLAAFEESAFEDGMGFDGSSIRGWQGIHESDMLVVPDPSTAFVDPFCSVPTLVLFCNIQDPITRKDYTRDPRNVCRKAAAYLKSTGIADTAFIGPEAEFFVFDDVRYGGAEHFAEYRVDSGEAFWNTARDEGPNLGYKVRFKEGYFPCPPSDSQQDLRSEMVLTMGQCGLEVEAHHHEVATAGQAEIDLRYKDLLTMADHLTLYKYIVRNVARKNGKVATFMPKPVFMDNGSGMHTHFSLWKDGDPLFAGEKYAGVSETALHAIGGILAHAPALVALTNPTTNSYRRLVPGFEAPNRLAYSSRNRSAAVRIPMYSPSPKAKRLEFRCPDPTCNPYLAFSALMMAGLDGIQNKIDPGDPVDKDIYDLSPEEDRKVPTTPGSLDEALDNLEKDHQFLLKGDVFTEDVLQTWIQYKRENEVDALRVRPHPHEFTMYFDA